MLIASQRDYMSDVRDPAGRPALFVQGHARPVVAADRQTERATLRVVTKD
jgi:hypothetical protein